MRRLLLAMAALCVATLPTGAQGKKPKPCAILVSADGKMISDPTLVNCEQGGDVGVIFCNNDPNNAHQMTVKKNMKGSTGTVQVLAADVTKNVPKSDCKSEKSNVLPNVTKDRYKYTVTASNLPDLDPDMDVALPSGLEQGRGRGRQ